MMLPRVKNFKILVDKVIVTDASNLNYSSVIIELRQKNGKLIKASSLNQINKFATIIETYDRIHLHFLLRESNKLGEKQTKPFANGVINVESREVQKQHAFSVKCPIKNKITQKIVINLTLTIKQDLQRINCSILQSDPSFVQQQQQKTERIKSHIVQPSVEYFSVVNPSTQNKPHRQQIGSAEAQKRNSQLSCPGRKTDLEERSKKMLPIRKTLIKPSRVRRCQYSLKNNQFPNFQVVNKVKEQLTNCMENWRIDLDDAISQIEVYSKSYQETLAEVMFKTNPTQQQLRQLKIKVPQSDKVIYIYLKTMEGKIMHAEVPFPELQSKQCLKIIANIKDETDKIKGRLKLNYKQSQSAIQDGNCELKQKMTMAKQVTILQKNKLDQLNCLPFLFSQRKIKVTESSRIKLPKINSKDQRLTPTPYHGIKDQFTPQEIFPNRKCKTIDYGSQYPHDFNAKISERKIIKVFGVSIKFYKSFLELPENQHLCGFDVGKSLLIYANSSNIYRSQASYESTILNWNLRKCEISINVYENLVLELCQEKEKTLIGDFAVSFNQLKYNQQSNSLYFGYLTKDSDVIAKVCIDCKLMNSQYNKKMNNLNQMQRKRVNRICTSDFMLNEEIGFNNKSKVKHMESSQTPQIKRKKRRLSRGRRLSRKKKNVG